MKIKKNIAFTLAEVIIVLGIIGTVAELTIPNLVTSFQKQATVTGYKKVYFTLTDAVKLSEANNDSINSWEFPITDVYGADPQETIKFLKTYIVPYLNIAKTCELNTGVDCFRNIKSPSGTGYHSWSSYKVNLVKYFLSDGTGIYFGSKSTNACGGLIEVLADINGLKAPNVMGKDVFSFFIIQNACSPVNRGDGNLSDKVSIGGVYPDGFNTNGSHYPYRGCGKDVTYGRAGDYCGMKIIKDGYEIKDDYPW